MTTEFHQPINPMRIISSTDETIFTHPVFAIAISNSHDVEYLTINGQFMHVENITHAEVLLNGVWTPIHTIEMSNPQT